VAFVGQVIASIGHILIFVTPGVITETWFPLSETALANRPEE